MGKSSLLNAHLGRERVIVSEVPGYDTDAIDTVLRRRHDVRPRGHRRPASKAEERQGIEYYSELRALEAAERADVALVLVDASEGVVDQDLTVADVGAKAQCATIVLLSGDDGDSDRGRAAADCHAPPPAATAHRRVTHTGRGLERLLISSRTLPRATRGALRPPSSTVRRRSHREAAGAGTSRPPPQPLYGTQVSLRLCFRLFVNDRRLVTRLRLLVENELRARFGPDGVPVSDRLRTSQ